MTYEIIIQFTDGNAITLSGVSEFGYKDIAYYVIKNNYRMFFNKDCVKYIGRTFDINNN